MPLKSLPPGVENAEEANLGSEMGWIGGNLRQRSGAGLKQQTEQDFLVLPDQRDQRVRHAEDEMEIAHRKQFLLPGAQPFLACISLALRTVAVSAGVVRDGLMPAAVALIAMAAECRCAAALDCPEHFELCPRQRTVIAFDESVSSPADDVGHLPGWPCHA